MRAFVPKLVLALNLLRLADRYEILAELGIPFVEDDIQEYDVVNAEEADRVRAQLALQGIESKVQRVSVDNDTWHRVRVGPVTPSLRCSRKQLSSCVRRARKRRAAGGSSRPPR